MSLGNAAVITLTQSNYFLLTTEKKKRNKGDGRAGGKGANWRCSSLLRLGNAFASTGKRVTLVQGVEMAGAKDNVLKNNTYLLK